jgi:cytokinin dehydrogenase
LIDYSEDALASVTEDFGHVMRGVPAGVVRPRSAEEVVDVVNEAVKSGYRLTPRGLGHSAGGQALPAESVVVDLSALNAVCAINFEKQTVRCEGGAVLRDVVSATLRESLLPRTLTNLLDLTVGGLLSVGGIGPGSHAHGPLIANVASLDVVTGDGALRRCSRESNRELYDAVLGGIGRCGVVVAAELELRPLDPKIRTYYLLYDDVRRWMADQRMLARMGSVASLEGFCSPAAQGLRGIRGERKAFAHWFFSLQVSFEFDDAAPELPRNLQPYRVLHVEDDDAVYFPSRHDVRMEAIRRIGGWDRPHPYIGALIDAEALVAVLPDVLEALPLNEGHRGTFIVGSDRIPPFMALPETKDVVFFAVMFPQVLPQLLEDTLAASQRAADLLVGSGGKRYIADWLGDPERVDWRGHFESDYESWIKAKHTFDPHDIFGSVLLS